MKTRRVDQDSDWADLAEQWQILPGTCYLNHGSFGPGPAAVRADRRAWIERLDSQPMDFFLRQLEPALQNARDRLARFVGARPDGIAFVENATFAMNVVAGSFPLAAGDEVLLSDHEYGAVHRIWQRQASRVGARVVTAVMPDRFESAAGALESILQAVSRRTRIVVLSHVTSPTGMIWPVAAWIPELRRRGIAVCIDGPHAPVQVPLDIGALDCDYYTASCHKWLCGPLGTGFLYVHRRQQATIQPPILSWGRLPPAVPAGWDSEFVWSGTRDPSGYLAIPAAIEFMESVGLEAFRQRTGWLAGQAESMLSDLLGTRPMGARSDGWYGSMALQPLPPGDWSGLQDRLWREYQIEIPVVNFRQAWYIRVSCHLYTTMEHIGYLERALKKTGPGRSPP